MKKKKKTLRLIAQYAFMRTITAVSLIYDPQILYTKTLMLKSDGSSPRLQVTTLTLLQVLRTTLDSYLSHMQKDGSQNRIFLLTQVAVQIPRIATHCAQETKQQS